MDLLSNIRNIFFINNLPPSPRSPLCTVLNFPCIIIIFSIVFVYMYVS